MLSYPIQWTVSLGECFNLFQESDLKKRGVWGAPFGFYKRVLGGVLNLLFDLISFYGLLRIRQRLLITYAYA